jgi:polyisoprenoid-binding protein YceI
MRCFGIGLAVLLALAGSAQAETFTLDKQHTEVRFSWDHLGLSRQSGRFLEPAGTISFDRDKPEATTIDVSVPIATLTTGVPALDALLVKSKDYFDAAGFPAATFKSTGFRMTGDKSAEVVGDLTINGVTKPVTFAVVLNFLGPHPMGSINPLFQDRLAAGFSARTQILRSEWGLTRMVPLVSDEIRLSIEAEMQKAP